MTTQTPANGHPLIKVSVKSVYGRNVYTPENDAARQLAAIAGTKTLTYQTISQARAIGCDVLVVVDALDNGRGAFMAIQWPATPAVTPLADHLKEI